MEFSFNVDDKREKVRSAKEEAWSGLNGLSDVVSVRSELKISDDSFSDSAMFDFVNTL